MNMSKLDLTREKSRMDDKSRNDEASFMRPATPLKMSQVTGNNVSQISVASRSKKSSNNMRGYDRRRPNNYTASNQ